MVGAESVRVALVLGQAAREGGPDGGVLVAAFCAFGVVAGYDYVVASLLWVRGVGCGVWLVS